MSRCKHKFIFNYELGSFLFNLASITQKDYLDFWRWKMWSIRTQFLLWNQKSHRLKHLDTTNSVPTIERLRLANIRFSKTFRSLVHFITCYWSLTYCFHTPPRPSEISMKNWRVNKSSLEKKPTCANNLALPEVDP